MNTHLLIGMTILPFACAAALQADTPIRCSADFNGDGTVNGADLSEVLGFWGTTDSLHDLSGNGTVGGEDLTIVLGQWNSICNPFHDNVTVTYDGDFAVVQCSGLPDHPIGPFDGSKGCFNPNTPTVQNDTWLIPLVPVPTDTPEIDVLEQPGPIGVLVSGAAFYNAYDGGGQEAPGNICMDACEGHPSPDGRYHYHQFSPCIDYIGPSADGHSAVIGFAWDGYPVTGLNEVGGMPPRDLDECGGHEDPARGYHYHFQAQFPWTIGCYHGEPEVSNLAGGGGGGGGGEGCQYCAEHMIPPPICNCVHTTPGLEYCCDPAQWDQACQDRLEECGG